MQDVDLHLVLDNLHDGVYFVDRDRVITYWNHGAERLTGFGACEVMGRRCRDNVLCHVNEAGESLCRGHCPLARTLQDGVCREAAVYLHHKDGHRVPVQLRVAPVRAAGGEIVGAVETFNNNSALHALRHRIEELEKLAMLDPLTGLPNRRFLEIRLQQKLEEFGRYHWPVAILVADLDHLKTINDQFGHRVGDLALRAAGRTLAHACRSVDTVGRWGGDEFVAVLSNCRADELPEMGERLRAAVGSSAVRVAPEPITLSMSLGLAAASVIDTAESLLLRADNALYASKSGGRNRATVASRP